MTVTRMARRRGLAALAAVVLAGTGAACTPPAPGGCQPAGSSPPLNLPAGSPWAGTLCPVTNQQPPASANGIVYRDGVLWIASFLGGELVAADAASGTIVGRFGPTQGVSTAPDDVAMTGDGTIYWTGMLTGEVGALSPADGRSRTVANAGIGVNPIALAPDGSLRVGHAYLASGLSHVDPATGAVRVLARDLALNGFAFGPDGALYAPRTDTIPARLVRVDPGTGRSTTVSFDAGLAAVSVRFPPATRGEAATTAYVLMASPPAVRRIDIRTGRRVGTDLSLPLAVDDNMAFAPDGTLYITANVSPTVIAVGVDGRMRTIAIGRS
jgi:streptogramin lyase